MWLVEAAFEIVISSEVGVTKMVQARSEPPDGVMEAAESCPAEAVTIRGTGTAGHRAAGVIPNTNGLTGVMADGMSAPIRARLRDGSARDRQVVLSCRRWRGAVGSATGGAVAEPMVDSELLGSSSCLIGAGSA